ncbi:MAG: transcriptional repressor [Nitrospiraceae bacterium]|nr:transcriptional repressor [Nitrospiraceae bacterium]
MEKDYRTTLKQNGLRVTPQRCLILKAFLNSGLHPTADEVWAKVKESFPSISRATVYNSLNEFASRGLVVPLNTPRSVRFDFNTKPHAHFICTNCGRVFDVPMNMKKLLSEVKLEGKNTESAQVFFYGTCEECKKLNRGG